MLGKLNTRCEFCNNEVQNLVVDEDYDNITYRCSSCDREFVKWDSEPELYNVSWEDFDNDEDLEVR